MKPKFTEVKFPSKWEKYRFVLGMFHFIYICIWLQVSYNSVNLVIDLTWVSDIQPDKKKLDYDTKFIRVQKLIFSIIWFIYLAQIIFSGYNFSSIQSMKAYSVPVHRIPPQQIAASSWVTLITAISRLRADQYRHWVNFSFSSRKRSFLVTIPV